MYVKGGQVLVGIGSAWFFSCDQLLLGTYEIIFMVYVYSVLVGLHLLLSK
jgi:hypothetical protein